MLNDSLIIELKEKLNREGIILSFTGPFSQGIIEEMGDALKSYLKDEKNNRGGIYKVFSVFIEQTQNVKNYAFDFDDRAEKEKILSSGTMIIGEKDSSYFVCSGNLIKKEDTTKLKRKLNQINDCDKENLDKLYKKRLRKEIKKDSGGAGLGLIDMARKADGRFEYNFLEQGEDYYFYTLTVTI
ncbi:MAG: SiaB family protein kinase [Bacillota bacterium]